MKKFQNICKKSLFFFLAIVLSFTIIACDDDDPKKEDYSQEIQDYCEVFAKQTACGIGFYADEEGDWSPDAWTTESECWEFMALMEDAKEGGGMNRLCYFSLLGYLEDYKSYLEQGDAESPPSNHDCVLFVGSNGFDKCLPLGYFDENK